LYLLLETGVFLGYGKNNGTEKTHSYNKRKEKATIIQPRKDLSGPFFPRLINNIVKQKNIAFPQNRTTIGAPKKGPHWEYRHDEGKHPQKATK